MNSISIASALHKMQIQTAHPWHILLTIIPDPVGHPDTILRLARENEDVTYKGDEYIAFNFDFDPIQDKSSGQLSSISMRVCNINRAIHYYLEQYEGGIGAKVELRVVSAEAMVDDPSVFMEFEIVEASADSQWATFSLGADNPMRKTFPKFIYLKDYCIWKYNTPAMQGVSDPTGLQCGYLGPIGTCSKTLEGSNGCRAHNNSSRFGAFPFIDSTGFRAASII